MEKTQSNKTVEKIKDLSTYLQKKYSKTSKPHSITDNSSMSRLIANIISIIMHPVVMAFFIGYTASIQFNTNATTTLLLFAPIAIIITTYIIIFVFIKQDADIEFTDVKTRPPLLFSGITGILISLLIAKFFLPEAESFFTRLLIIITAVTTITFYWKISFHATIYTMAIFYSYKILGNNYLFLLALLPILYWSRIKLHKHELAQLIIGSIISSLIIL